jgi:mRNA-degrading endonuclease RelE of RelBE toxin-antitoxin system
MPRVKIEFNDEVSKQLMKLSKTSPDILEKVLLKLSSEMKISVDRTIRGQFEENTGKMRKKLNYVKTGTARYQLRLPNLYAVFERGAEIFPQNVPLLKWQDKSGNWYSSNWVSIEPRPFFYPTIRSFQSSGRTNIVAQNVIDQEIRKMRWGM